MGAFSYYENYFINMTVSLVAWEEVYRLKFEGSLGNRQNEDVNREKHVKNNFFWIFKKSGNSIVWKEVINLRKYIRDGLKWYIGNDKKVCFWTTHWVYMLSLVFFFFVWMKIIYITSIVMPKCMTL